MRGPRNIAESVSSLHNGRLSTTASVSAFDLHADYAGLSDESGNVSYMDKRPSGFGHHSSTRDMVERYERMCTPPPDARSSRKGYGVQGHPSRRDGDHGMLVKKDKNKSPLRQSIRNLLLTLKKGAGKSGEVISAAKGIRKHSTSGLVSEHPPQVPEKDSVTGDHLAFPSKPSREQVTELYRLPVDQSLSIDSNKVDFSGPIWYLSKASDGTAIAWNSCNGVITGRKLSITWFSHEDSNHRVLEVDLSRCIDVRSLTNGDMNQEDLELLNEQEETHGLKVLELVSRSRQTDRFAVRNFGERAAWVTALWDSILPTTMNTKGSFGSLKELTYKLGQPQDERRSHIGHTMTMHAAPKQTTVGVRRERSLPPLPPKTPRMLPPLTIPPTSLISRVDIMPRIDSARTPSPSVYSPGPPPPPGLPSPATSPSVTDLGRRSMVKQRLAELEKDQSMQSPSLKRTSGSLSPFSPVSTAGTGRSGFLSVLTSEEEVELGEHKPFEHLRESKFLPDLGVSSRAAEDRTPERPAIERYGSTCSELPYTNDNDSPDDDRSTKNGHLKHISDDLSTIKNFIGLRNGGKTLHQTLLEVDNHSHSTKRKVEELVQKFEYLQMTSSPPSSCRETREVLEVTRVELSRKIDALMESLGNIDKAPKDAGTEISSSHVPSLVATKADLSTLKEHLDGKLSAHTTSLLGQVSIPGSAGLSELSKIRALIESDDGQRALQIRQQADSVRYLNELNSWLESFVRNGTAQINGLATNIERLCRDLCSEPGSSRTGILNDIYTVLLELRSRNDPSTLRYSVDKLAEIINANSANSMNVQALANFMERQRQDQEAFLRAFTVEISGEIKGERLRFVEAMKEATVINVQMQVDQLKKELARQIVTVSQDLGRLESEKREVETKIANLHAFHANQKRTSGQPSPLTVTANRQTYRPLSRQPQYPATYSQNRPLPHPR